MPAGSACPTATTTSRPRSASGSAREVPRAHQRRSSRSPARPTAEAKAAAETVFAIETRLAERVAGQRRAARPAGDRSQDDVRRAAEARRRTSTGRAYFEQAGAAARATSTSNEPKFMQAVDRQLRQTPLADWKTYLTWHAAERGRALALHGRSWRRTSSFYEAVPRRRDGDEAALEALRRADGRAARRGARPQVRREAFPARGQGAHAGAGEEPAARPWATPSRASTG